VNRPKVPLACITSHPRSIARSQAGLVFVRRAFLAKQEWPVDQLDVDPAVLHGLGAVGDLNELAVGLFGVGVRSVSCGRRPHPLVPVPQFA